MYVEDDFVDSGHPGSNSSVRRKRGKQRRELRSSIQLTRTQTTATSSVLTTAMEKLGEEKNFPDPEISGRNGERRQRGAGERRRPPL